MPDQTRRTTLSLLLGALALSACGDPIPREDAMGRGDLNPNETPQLRRQIERAANDYDVPFDLVQRVVKRESGHRPDARNGPYYGLMQIHPRTAETMGYRGSAQGLLVAETNLKYGVKYLRGAWLVSRGDRDAAVGWYSRGYYYEAKRMGLLEETGLRG
jgi:soluble lytic murein transglycosylase-like protein